jgi:hypothetical protein
MTLLGTTLVVEQEMNGTRKELFGARASRPSPSLMVFSSCQAWFEEKVTTVEGGHVM